MSKKTPKKSIAGTPEPSDPTRTRRVDWQWLVAGFVILGVSLFLLVAQSADPNAATGLFSGPMGQALNIGGVVAGIWVIWKAFKG
jgi:hypothetical protein